MLVLIQTALRIQVRHMDLKLLDLQVALLAGGSLDIVGGSVTTWY
jgi:hypothetical protein